MSRKQPNPPPQGIKPTAPPAPPAPTEHVHGPLLPVDFEPLVGHDPHHPVALRIGKFVVTSTSPGSICIVKDGGMALLCSERDVADVIEAFYRGET